MGHDQRTLESMLARQHFASGRTAFVVGPQYRLHPLSVREVVDPASPPADYEPDQTLERLVRAAGAPPPAVLDAFAALLRWGGFPEPFVRGTRDSSGGGTASGAT